jgi:hypothetical protein
MQLPVATRQPSQGMRNNLCMCLSASRIAYRANILRDVLCRSTGALVAGGDPNRQPKACPVLPDLPQTEVAIVKMTNAFRRQNALQELRPNAAQTTAARAYAECLPRRCTH